MSYFVAIDSETAGFSLDCFIVQLALVPSWDCQPLNIYIMPPSEATWEPGAIDKINYSAERWRDRGATSITEANDLLASWLAGDVSKKIWRPVSHNAAYDDPRIRRCFPAASGIPSSWRCSMQAFRACLDTGVVSSENNSASLQALALASGAPLVWHDALSDAQACLHGYLWLLEKIKGRAA